MKEIMKSGIFYRIDENGEGFLYDRETMAIIPISKEEVDIIQSKAFGSQERLVGLMKEAKDAIANIHIDNIIPADENRKLETIVLPLTSNCNLACPYCFAKSNKKSIFSDLTEEDISILISYLIGNCKLDRVNIVFFGGEPTLRLQMMENVINRLRYECSGIEFGYSITTNGTLVNNSLIDFFVKYNIAILISLDGVKNEYNHRKFKNGKHSFDRVIKSIELLKSRNINFEIRATLTCDNPYIFETYKYFESLGRPYTIAFAYDSYNAEAASYTDFSNLEAVQSNFNKLEEFMVDKISKGKKIYDKTLSTFFNRIKYRVRYQTPCLAGRSYFTLMHKGDLFTCPHLISLPENTIGNLKINPECIHENRLGVPVSVESINICNKCWAKFLCVGGCASQKLSYCLHENDPLPEARCKIEKLIFSYYLSMVNIILKHSYKV